MDSSLYFGWLIAAFLIFFYSISKTDWRGTLIFVSMMLFLALGIASWDITTTHVFYDQTNHTVVEHLYHEYSQANSYLCYGMGVLSLVVGFVYSFNVKKSMEMLDDE